MFHCAVDDESLSSRIITSQGTKQLTVTLRKVLHSGRDPLRKEGIIGSKERYDHIRHEKARVIDRQISGILILPMGREVDFDDFLRMTVHIRIQRRDKTFRIRQICRRVNTIGDPALTASCPDLKIRLLSPCRHRILGMQHVLISGREAVGTIVLDIHTIAGCNRIPDKQDLSLLGAGRKNRTVGMDHRDADFIIAGLGEL